MQKRLYLTPLAVIVFILFFTVFGDRGLLRINHLHRDRDEMQKRLSELKGENDKLKREIAALQSDRRYLESIARRDFGLVRSNEVIYQFPAQPHEAGGKADQKAAPPAEQAPQQGKVAHKEQAPAKDRTAHKPEPAPKADPAGAKKH